MTTRQNEALQAFATGISQKDADLLLRHLRWRVDQRIINHFGTAYHYAVRQVVVVQPVQDGLEAGEFGQEVWLRACYDATGKRIGITECCFADDPCDHHRAIVTAAAAAKEKP